MTLDQLASALQAGTITLPEWESQMRDMIKFELTAAMELAKDGRGNITQSDWGYLGSQAKEQYDRLSAFADEIEADPGAWLNGRRLNQRMGLYGQLGYSALEDDLSREHQKDGFTEEFNEIEAGADHCSDCEEQHSMGWVPIGTLSKIGSRKCCTNDRCFIKYRKPDGNGGWIEGKK